ncbi:MAG: Benzoate-CoA ligase [Myxococcaceae bacterium]|nr:Benzoate-CoA ligase [Myxococcaceae bacterium]
MTFARIDDAVSPPRVTFPRPYNAAVDLLDRHLSEGRGDRVAYVDDDGPCTYAALADRADRAGNALLALRVVPEQRVMLAMPDPVDFVAGFLGAIKLPKTATGKLQRFRLRGG